MSPIRALLLAPVFAAVAAVGTVFWIFSTEITAANAQVQVSRICVTSNIAISIDRMTGLSGLKPARYDCACTANTLASLYPGEKGARLANETRLALFDRFKYALVRSTPPKSKVDRATLNDIRRYLDRIGKQCPLKA